jgi:poly(3-hydroxybutyrate) depolymerase
MRCVKPLALASYCAALCMACCAVLGSGSFVRAAPDAGSMPAPAIVPAPPSTAELRAELARVRGAQQGKLAEGAFSSIEYALDVAERIARSFGPQSEALRQRVAHYLSLAAKGRDPLLEARGKLVMRGYHSAVSERLQGYSIYTPPDYDPARAYPLLIMLHGGSANGNLFLGVVLGNNMNWKEYPIHLWDAFEPRFSPDWIVVAPDGFGQVMWRWMGEQDVLDVLDDVQHHYHVDADQVVLGGLSNGGVGAYNLGMRYAHRFSIVQAIAGAPSWLQYSGGNVPAEQRRAMEPLSGMQLAENAIDTDFRYYHGRSDTGPMRPRFVEELGKLIRTLGVPFKETWYDAGHDLLYLVHRHGGVFADLAKVRRKPHPSEVRVVTGDYRAARQHWVTVDRIEGYPTLARVRAVVAADTVTVETKNTRALSLDLREAPLSAGDQARIVVDGKQVYAGPRAALGGVVQLIKDEHGFRLGAPTDDARGLDKKPGSCGPITDAYYGAIAHVYGTADASATDALKKTAERGAHGWPLWLWDVQQKVVADTEVTDELMRSHSLVLYATPGSNRVLERIAASLPVRIDADGVVLGGRRIQAPGVGVKLIYPNPLAPGRYVIVQAAPTVAGVQGGHNLPDFLPDYVVYDARTTATRPRLVFERSRMPQAMGYFDDHWQLPTSVMGEGGDEQPADAPHGSKAKTSQLPLSPVLPPPAPPTEFLAPPESQAGQAARRIAQLVPTFTNYRATIRGAVWQSDPLALWSIRDNERCLQELRERGIPFKSVAPTLTTPVPTPVEVTGPVDGVDFHMVHAERTLLMSCELAARLPDLAAALKPHGVERVEVISSYRAKPFVSFHTMGLALDVWRFYTKEEGVLSVLADFERTPNYETCKAPPPKSAHARALLDIACRIADSKRFSSVLTPNYNEGHRNHFHLDIRPDDPRVFVR